MSVVTPSLGTPLRPRRSQRQAAMAATSALQNRHPSTGQRHRSAGSLPAISHRPRRIGTTRWATAEPEDRMSDVSDDDSTNTVQHVDIAHHDRIHRHSLLPANVAIHHDAATQFPLTDNSHLMEEDEDQDGNDDDDDSMAHDATLTFASLSQPQSGETTVVDGSLSAMAKQAAPLSLSSPWALDAKEMLADLAGLYADSVAVLNMLPATSESATVGQFLADFQDPESTTSTRFIRRIANLADRVKLFKKSTEKYIYCSAVNDVLLRPDMPVGQPSEEIIAPAAYRPDEIVMLANLALYAASTLQLHARKNDGGDRSENIDRLYDFLAPSDRSFPILFATSVAESPITTEVGATGLAHAFFEHGLNLRTQLAIDQLRRAMESALDPDNIITSLFFQSASGPGTIETTSQLIDLRDCVVGSFAPARHDHERHILARKDTISSFYENYENDENIDIAGLQERFPWPNFVASVIWFVRARGDEIETAVRSRGGVDRIVEVLRNRTNLTHQLATADRPESVLFRHPLVMAGHSAQSTVAQSRTGSIDLSAPNSGSSVHVAGPSGLLFNPADAISRFGQAMSSFIPSRAVQPVLSRPGRSGSVPLPSEVRTRPLPPPRRFIDPQQHAERVMFSQTPTDHNEEHGGGMADSGEPLPRLSVSPANGESDDGFDPRRSIPPPRVPSTGPQYGYPLPHPSYTRYGSHLHYLQPHQQQQQQMAYHSRNAQTVPPPQPPRRSSGRDFHSVVLDQPPQMRAYSSMPGPQVGEVSHQSTPAPTEADPSTGPVVRAATEALPSLAQPRVRRRWSAEEEQALIYYVGKYRTSCWSLIKSEDYVNGDVLHDRTQVDLKDKARNLRLAMEKRENVMPGFETVTLKTSQVRMLAELRASREAAADGGDGWTGSGQPATASGSAAGGRQSRQQSSRLTPAPSEEGSSGAASPAGSARSNAGTILSEVTSSTNE